MSMAPVQERPTTAVVTGATGVIGPELVRRLVGGGLRVRVLVRREPEPGLLPAGVEVVKGDIANPEAVRAAVSDMNYVFHLAAKLHINNPGVALAGEYRAANVEGTRHVAEAARIAGARRLVFFSTIAVYGATTPGEVLHEDSPSLATSLYAATKREAEQLLLGMRREADGEPLAVILRIAGVYGSRIKGNYRELVRWLRRGIFLPIGSGENRRTLVYEQDVADAAILAASHPAAAGRIFNVTDGSVHTFNEIVRVICGVLERRPPRLHVPLSVARTCAHVVDAGLAAGGRSRKAAPLIEKLVEDMAVDGSRIQRELGFRPSFDLESGWAATIPQLVP